MFVGVWWLAMVILLVFYRALWVSTMFSMGLFRSKKTRPSCGKFSRNVLSVLGGCDVELQ